MKNILRLFSLSLLFAGMSTTTHAQRSREFRGGGNTRAEGNYPRASTERGAAPVRSFGNQRAFPSRPQADVSRQITVRQAPDRNFNQSRVAETRNFQNPSGNERVFSQRNANTYDQRAIVSRDNFSRGGNFDRDRAVSRFPESNDRYDRGYSERRFDRDDHYFDRDDRYGYVYGRRTSFMYGTRYREIPHNFISIHFGGYPYYYYGGCFYGYYNGFYDPIFPPFGIHIGILPFGYVRLFIGGIPYFYYNGIYYRHYDDYYEVVDAPLGAIVSLLPNGTRSVVINGESLYELNGTYYKQEVDNNGNQVFEVVGKNGVVNNTSVEQGNAFPDASTLQIGDTVPQLPDGSKIVTINGQEVYQTPDNFYLQQENNNGMVQYRVIGK